MTDLVAQLVGALEGMADLYDTDEGCKSLPQYIAARAALSAAKGGGWVAVPERTTGDAFENAIRRYGVVAACEWFGHAPHSEFTQETQRVLDERLRPLPNPPKGEV